jgi:alginate O-acetyltransferase complex protein AlgI
LITNHAIRRIVGQRPPPPFLRVFGWLVTFIAVVVGWVFFRATSLDIAIDILRAMLGGTYIPIDDSLLGINRLMAVNQCLVWLASCASIALFAPNAYDLIGRGLRTTLESRFSTPQGGVVLGTALVFSLLLLAISETRGVSEFLYFNF